MNKKNYRHKKTRAEVTRYKNSLGEGGGGIDSTYTQDSSFLVGSEGLSKSGSSIRYRENEEPVEKKPFHFVIRDWFRQNAVETILTIILIPMFIWIVSSVIEIQKESAVAEYRVGRLEEDIGKLSDNVPNKESLKLELDNLMKNIDEINDKELENRIDALEKSVYK